MAEDSTLKNYATATIIFGIIIFAGVTIFNEMYTANSTHLDKTNPHYQTFSITITVLR